MPSITYTLTTAGHNLFRDATAGVASLKITYVALGTSSTGPTVNDTRLGNEIFRKAVTSWTNGASIGEILINMYLAPGETVGTGIQEVGFFGGSATGAVNSGVMLARGLYTHTKSNVESISFQIDLTT